MCSDQAGVETAFSPNRNRLFCVQVAVFAIVLILAKRVGVVRFASM